MADNIVAGLFGLDPYQIQQQRQAQIDSQAQQYAQMQPFERATAGMYKTGAGLGKIGAGMLGMVDPMEERARVQQQAIQGADTQTPQGLRAFAARLQSLNMPQQAMIAATKANELEKTQQELALKNAQESLVYAQAMKALKEPANLTEAIKEYKFAKEEEGYTGTFQDWIKQKAEATGKGESVSPIAYIDESGKPVWGTIREARGKQAAQYSPETKGAIAEAAETGKGIGEARTTLSMAEATYPQLDKTVNQLKELADKATFTLAGQARDIVARQVGKSTEGAVARERYMQTVRDVLFPQLRATFGAQFTAKEGEALIATMGDPNKTPQERVAALEAFIDQKKQTIESLRRQVGKNNKKEWTAKTPEEVKALYKAGRLSKEEAKAILKDMGFQNGG